MLTENHIIHNGIKLFQIQALIDFGSVSAGELGGCIESGTNLSQEGNAWVSGDAQVSDAKTHREYALLIEVAESRIPRHAISEEDTEPT